MAGKIVTAEALATISREMRSDGKRLVFTNGCFDLLHLGHIRYLQAARALGDGLAVGINGDDSVHQLKGAGRPLNNERDRAEVVASLAAVDYVVIFPEVRATRLLAQVCPGIYVKGGDYTADTLNPEERRELEICGTEIRILPFEKGFSTSRIIRRIRELDL